MTSIPPLPLHFFEVEIYQRGELLVKRDDIKGTDAQTVLGWVKVHLGSEAAILLKELGYKPELSYDVRRLDDQLSLL